MCAIAVAVNGFPVSVESGRKAIKVDRSVVESRYLNSVFVLRASVGDGSTVLQLHPSSHNTTLSESDPTTYIPRF